jgi:hypothetical protein
MTPIDESNVSWGRTMKRVFILALSLIVGLCCLSAGNLRKTQEPLGGRTTVDSRVLDVNRFRLYVTDRGHLDFEHPFGPGGAWFDSANIEHPIVFDQGPWIIGKLQGKPAAAMTLWGSSFSPGPVIGGKPALDVQPGDSIRFHPYKISRTSSPSDSDAATWPVDLGAPVGASGKPQLLGDQLIWSVFNGADTTMFAGGWAIDPALRKKQQFPRLPVEIHQSIYARKAESLSDTSLLANTVFIEWTFINKGTAQIESCYIALWADIDIDFPPLNSPAVDTSLQLGYLWLRNPTFNEPYAVGYILLHGPCVSDPGQSAVFQGATRTGYRNLGLSSFLGICQSNGKDSLLTSAPNKLAAAWNTARGFDKLGRTILDSATGLPTRFPFSGDPVSGSGWIHYGPSEGETGVLMFSGPFNLAAGDTQWTMLALVPANAGEPKASITQLRQKAARLRAMTYSEIANPTVLGIRSASREIPATLSLRQNFPNPFNPTTTIRFELPTASSVTLVVYDVLGREVSTLVNGSTQAGIHDVVLDANRLASGVYLCRLQSGGFTQSRRMMLVR